jgi:hypothetical protein
MSLTRAAAEFVTRSRKIEPALARLDSGKFFQRLRGQWLVLRTFLPLGMRLVSLKQLSRGNVALDWLKILLGLMMGRRFRDLAYKHLRPPRMLRLAVLPFEEYHSLDAARMESCKAVFAYEDVPSGQVKTIPACTWYHYRNPLLEEISRKYGVAPGAETPAAT